jgi:hypothetical protein
MDFLETHDTRPDVAKILADHLEKYDWSELEQETNGDAVAFVHEMRGWHQLKLP